jgi:L-xylulokinase
MHSRILALDAGSSSIKAVLFDETGKCLSSDSTPVPLIRKEHGVVERDLDRVWNAVITSISRIRETARKEFGRIDAVSVTGAGDGLILLDDSDAIVMPAITSLDTRASDLVERFKKGRDAKALYDLIGEIPYPATPLALLRWTKIHERTSYDRARKILFLKDWVRYKLTSQIFTDVTDASATLTDLRGEYCREVFDSFGVREALKKTVAVKESRDIAGYVTKRASSLTGLKAGIPVICGLHDCSASSLGTACTRAGQACLIAGSWAGNQIVADRPILNRRHPDRQILRRYAIPGTWLIISASPTSLVNLDWFLWAFRPAGQDDAGRRASLYAMADGLVRATGNDTAPVFHPYLYGSQTSEDASGGFYGIRPWHAYGHLLKAIYEGIAINYSIHQATLEECLSIKGLHVCGGGTQSKVLVQTIADAVGRRMVLYPSQETTALGAAITAAVGVGLYRSFAEACKAMVSAQGSVSPQKEKTLLMARKRATFTGLYRRMVPFWKTLS